MNPKIPLRHKISRALLDVGNLRGKKNCVIYLSSQSRGHWGHRILVFEICAKLRRQHTPPTC